MSALLPCPFCGSADVELRESITDACIACNNCGCRTGFAQLGRDNASAAFSKRGVAAVWNTRPKDAAPTLLEALERAAEVIGGPSDFDGLEDDDFAIMPVRVRVGDVKLIRAAINAAKGLSA